MSRHVVILGLSITSSWGNGHATTFRGLVRALAALDCDVLFLERDVPWYASHRDQAEPPGCRTSLYGSLEELEERFGAEIEQADAVVVGSYVPQGIELARRVLARARGVRAFYDIDTPVTLARLRAGVCAYLSEELVPAFDLYLSFAGGPTLARLEDELGARRARPLYCAVDTSLYRPLELPERWDLAYLGTHSHDRQPGLEELLLEPARRAPELSFAVAGPGFPGVDAWPQNVAHQDHVAPDGHAAFYGAQRFALNLTRADMRSAGWAPSVRLFEASACGVPLLSDAWPGLEAFFRPGEEILLARSAQEVLEVLRGTTRAEARRIGERARRRVLAEHTPERRAEELLLHLEEARPRRGRSPVGGGRS